MRWMCTIQTFGVSKIKKKELILEFSNDALKSDSKDIYNVQQNYISNKCCSFERSIHQRTLDKNMK